MPIGSLKGELTPEEKKQQRGMQLVTLAGKVASQLRRKPNERVRLWDGITNNMAGRYDPDAKSFDAARVAMIRDFIKRHPELKGKLDASRMKS